jgi:tetratricopeptide (TPR) repeat protein
MTILTDSHGLAVSTQNRSVIARYDHAARLLEGFRADPLAEIDAAIAGQPDFAMGHAFRAGLMLLSTEAGAAVELRRSIEAGEAVRQANERERAHLAAARAWLEGDFHLAGDRYGAIVREWPRDLFALQVAHQLDFFLGSRAALRDRPAAALDAWVQAEPGFGSILGMQAFGLEENGEYPEAEAAGREAVALERTDAWAIHAVAHVLEMQGRDLEGASWLGQREADWTKGALLAVHNWWHLALFHLERGAFDKVLAIYDRGVAPGTAPVAIELIDASAMLWRLILRGVNVGDRWVPLAEAWSGLATEGYYAFNDLHALMASLGAGRQEEASMLLAAMRHAAQRNDSNAAMLRKAGLPLAEGFWAFARGDWKSAISHILPVRERALCLGGSNAQRDIVSLTLLEAALRGGEASLARALAGERLLARPESPLAQGLMERARLLPRPV